MSAARSARRRLLRIGVMVPSSNTVVETVMPRLLPASTKVSLHFARLPVTHISGSAKSKAQFEIHQMVETAAALADVEPDAIVWAGTAASWLGFARDEALSRRLTKVTGVPSTTSLLAVNEDLSRLSAKRIGLVTPYVAALEKDIIENYRAAGIEVVASERLDLTVNTDFAKVPSSDIARMCRSVAKAKPEAVVIMCTNLAGATIAGSIGKSLGIPVVDSVEATLSSAVDIARQWKFSSPSDI